HVYLHHSTSSSTSVLCELVDRVPCELVDNVLCELVDRIPCELVDRVLCELVDRVLCELVDRVLCELIDRVLCEVVDSVLCELVDQRPQRTTSSDWSRSNSTGRSRSNSANRSTLKSAGCRRRLLRAPDCEVCFAQARAWPFPVNIDAQLKWERKNQKAFAQFCNALVPDELIRLVREFDGKTELGSAPVDGGARAVTQVPAGTAAAYTRVKEFYLHRGLCNWMALSEDLSSLKMKEGERVAAYWARAEDLRSKYFAAGGKEEVEEWMMRVLNGLPPHFEMLKVVLNNQSSSLTKDQVLTSLRSEEMRIGVAPRSNGVATFGAGTKVGSSGKRNWDKEESTEATVAAAAPTQADGVRGKAKQECLISLGGPRAWLLGGCVMAVGMRDMHGHDGKGCVIKRGERVLAIGEKEGGRDHGLVRMSLPLARGTQGSALGIQSGTGGEEVEGDAGVVEGMLCLAREVEGVPLAGVSTGDVSRTLAEALCGPEGPACKTGAEKEVNAMRNMGVWDPETVDLPPGKKAIGVKYVFCRKTDKEDKVVQHKVRLVAKGYTQEPEKDFDQGRFGNLLKETHRAHTPMSPNDLSKIIKGTWSSEEGATADVKVYQGLIGSLMYAAVTTRPDMSFTVNTLAQSCVAPRDIHMHVALRALRYLVDTADRVIRYERQGGEQVVGYTDPDWGGETDGKSRSAYIFKLGGGAISWYSKRQDSVAASVSEAEYKTLSEGTKEAIWLRSLLVEMHLGDGGLFHCSVIMRMLSPLPTIPFSISAPSALRWLGTLYGMRCASRRSSTQYAPISRTPTCSQKLSQACS
ncbi:unnamed protein product, partial [Closterium sp. NIES-54]